MDNALARRRPAASRAAKLGVALTVAALAWVAAPAEAEAGAGDSAELRLSWRMAPPTLRLQPESARLVLTLPIEWMPPPDLGPLGVRLDPNKYWRFRNGPQLTSASIGQGLRLQIEDREHAVWFGLSVLPRAAFATLRFDPLPAQVR